LDRTFENEVNMGRQRTDFQSAIRDPRSAIGFTLVELLVVIGIIVLLVGILLPVVNGVRKHAYNAASQNQISRITAAMEAYNGDHRAYPGPFSNDQINTHGSTGGAFPGTLSGANVTMTENVVLGLIGGLKLTTSGIDYDVERVAARMGPMSLNSAAPKGGSPYMQVQPAEFSLASVPSKTKNYQSEFGGPVATDSIVPEFLDHYPDALPVLILRARRGAPGVISVNNTPAPYQYDLNQISGYTMPSTAVPGRTFNGKPAKTGIGGNPTTTGHGLQVLGQPKLITALPAAQDPWGSEGTTSSTSPPYDAITYFMNPQLTPATPAPTNATGIARQKDGYIIISPGKDRVYGTRDDITNFGGVQ